MKKTLFFLFFLLNLLAVQAQTKQYESLLADGRAARITVTYKGADAYVRHEYISASKGMKTNVYNELGKASEDNLIRVPSNSSSWIIPFDTPQAIASGGDCIQFACECKMGPQTCVLSTYRNLTYCDSNNSDPCNNCSLIVYRVDCADKSIVKGAMQLSSGFLLIQAGHVFFQ